MPATELRNEVLWSNPEILFPFDIQVGKQSKLALFFSDNDKEPDFELGIRDRHWRSGDIGKVFFRDTKGRIYRDVDLKGCGGFRRKGQEPGWRYRPSEEDHFGLLDQTSAEFDSRMAEIFTQNGIRTHRSIAIFGLHELPFYTEKNKKYTVEQLTEQKLLRYGIKPVIQMRAFGTKTRLAEVDRGDGAPNEQVRSKILDAMDLVAIEAKKRFSAFSYVNWFAKTLGENIGRMHKLGYTHGYLNDLNITLDCRIVDLDSLVDTRGQPPVSVELRRDDDLEKAGVALAVFIFDVEHHFRIEIPDHETIREEFRNVYFANLR